ncbi:MAG: hypothetical protein JXJ04_13615, partial [Spirochaetales bacterium]|nr:hypothetical protein [Spirochaetales bacterium]
MMKIDDHFMRNFTELLCIIQFLQSLSTNIGDVITQRGKSEFMLKQTRDELDKKNIALREVFSQIELEKRQIKDSVEKNVDRLILPLLNELENKTDDNKDIFILL